MGVSYSVKSFAYGELSQKFASRIDTAFYMQGCREMTNAFALPIGPAEKRPGTIYMGTGKTLGKKVRWVPWIIDPNTGLGLEFGENYIRFYKNGVVLGAPYEVATTYTAEELPDLRVAQVSSYMYIVHPSHKVGKLTRVTDTNWTLADVTFTAGAGEETFSTADHYPSHVEFYEDRLILARTNTNPATFWGSRVGQYENFSMRTSYTAAAASVTPIASPGVVNWTAHGLSANVAIMFSTTGALPTGLVAGTTYYVMAAALTANTFQVSATAGGAAINFTGATSGNHTVYASPALATDAWMKTPRVQANAQILWIVAEDALLFGTSEGPFRVGGKEIILTGDGAWWPNRQAAVGSSSVQALLVDDFCAFVGKGGTRIFRFQYEQAADKYIPDDITYLSDHLFSPSVGSTWGVIGMAHQREPGTIMWAWTADGRLLAGSYSRATGTIGWSEVTMTGLVESACVIPTATEDQVLISVARTIGGVVYRHLEYLAPRNWENMEDYHGVDAGIIWDGGTQKTVTSITNANPAICTAVAHGFSNNDLVRFSGVAGITDVNGQVYTVKNRATDTFQLFTRDGSTAIDFSLQSLPGSGGLVEKVTNLVSGLGHLEGQTVKTLGDASVIGDEVVTGGAITLDEYANKIHTGLPFTSIVEPMQIAEARNRVKHVTKVYAQFYKTGDAQVGDGTHPDKQITFEGVPTMDVQPTEHTEGLRELFDGFSDYDGTVRITSTEPLPQTVLGIICEVEVGA